MLKRGQISIIILLAFVILIVIALTIYIRNSEDVETATLKSYDLSEDVKIFESYIQSVLDDALSTGILVWANNGGKDLRNEINLKKSYDINGYQREIAYLYKNKINYFSIENARDELSSIVLAFFISDLDEEVFTERGYSFEFESPEIEISVNERSVTAVLQPDMVLERNSVYKTREFLSESFVEVDDVLNEVDNIINALKESDSYNFTKDYYSALSQIKVCGFDDKDGAYLVRILYQEPFELYDSFRFDFLTDIPLADNWCTT